MDEDMAVHVIGGGLAGSEAAWQLAERGRPVVLHEMRPIAMTPAHKTGGLAELVCSNSFRSDDAGQNCVGLLHQELRQLDSLIMRMADTHRIPAGGALAVDREAFSAGVQLSLERHPLITVRREEITGFSPDWASTIIASGPLTSQGLAEAIAGKTGQQALSFFDAIAPIVYRDSINMDIAWVQSRYDKGETGGDYINCPMDRTQYEAFVRELIDGEKSTFHDWEKDSPYFSGCLPVEVMAESGPLTLRWGPMKPVGLTNPRLPAVKPFAIVQLRPDNSLKTLYNMVGFQTKLKHAEQVRIFRTIPGLEHAEFARLGGIHRNTYIHSPSLLDGRLSLKTDTRLSFAGQITGCEGYVESTAIGLLAGLFAAFRLNGVKCPLPPQTTAIGALLAHITGVHATDDNVETQTIDNATHSFQPMNVNFGLFRPLSHALKSPEGKRLRGSEKSRAKKQALSDRARADFVSWHLGLKHCR
jgi:methylenetetrahydrofolate--tRNA-(uracil-5-)-methyltransferase